MAADLNVYYRVYRLHRTSVSIHGQVKISEWMEPISTHAIRVAAEEKVEYLQFMGGDYLILEVCV